MPSDPIDDPHSTAIKQLREFGLRTPAARTFVALVELGSATAQEVSEASAVPRTRVYDVAEERCECGLVEREKASRADPSVATRRLRDQTVARRDCSVTGLQRVPLPG